MARTGLGRGLDVLLGGQQTPTATVAPASATTEIPLEKIAPNPQQPRMQFDPDAINELAASIRRHGLLQPIVVSRQGDGYELVAGHRRVLAARAAGKTTIPAVVRAGVSDGEMLELALVENLQRRDLDPFEEADGIQNLVATLGLTHEEAARRLGRSGSSSCLYPNTQFLERTNVVPVVEG